MSLQREGGSEQGFALLALKGPLFGMGLWMEHNVSEAHGNPSAVIAVTTVKFLDRTQEGISQLGAPGDKELKQSLCHYSGSLKPAEQLISNCAFPVLTSVTRSGHLNRNNNTE